MGNNLFRFGSGSANCKPSRNYNFEFSYITPASRKLMMDFMDSVPIGEYVVVRSFDYNYNQSFINNLGGRYKLIWIQQIIISLFAFGRFYTDRFH